MSRYCFGYMLLCVFAFCNVAYAFETHCEEKTEVIFSCRIEKSRKVVSICKIGTKGPNAQYLQYRFGKIGSAELIYPKRDRIEESQFSFYRQYSKSAGYLEYDLTFYIGRNKYNVYWIELSAIDGVPMEKSEITSGVNVITSKGKALNLSCEGELIKDFQSAYTTHVRNVEGTDQHK